MVKRTYEETIFEAENDNSMPEPVLLAKKARTKPPRKPRGPSKTKRCKSVVTELRKELKKKLKEAIIAGKQSKIDIKCLKKDIKKLGRKRKAKK